MSTLSAWSLALGLGAAFALTQAAVLIAPLFLGVAAVALILGIIGALDARRARLAGGVLGWLGAVLGLILCVYIPGALA